MSFKESGQVIIRWILYSRKWLILDIVYGIITFVLATEIENCEVSLDEKLFILKEDVN